MLPGDIGRDIYRNWRLQFFSKCVWNLDKASHVLMLSQDLKRSSSCYEMDVFVYLFDFVNEQQSMR